MYVICQVNTWITFNSVSIKGECLVIQSLDTRMYNEFLEILEKEGGFKDVDMLVEGKKYQITGQEKSHL